MSKRCVIVIDAHLVELESVDVQPESWETISAEVRADRADDALDKLCDHEEHGDEEHDSDPLEEPDGDIALDDDHEAEDVIADDMDLIDMPDGSDGEDVVAEIEHDLFGHSSDEQSLWTPAGEMSDHHSDDDAKSVDAGAEAAELVEIPMAKAAAIGKFVDDFKSGIDIVTLYNHGDLVATCADPRHGKKCRLTRTTRPPPKDIDPFANPDMYFKGRRLKGRPIGFLWAWLRASGRGEFEDARQHVHDFVCDRPERLEARRLFYEMDGARTFAEHVEAERRDDEDDEPL